MAAEKGDGPKVSKKRCMRRLLLEGEPSDDSDGSDVDEEMSPGVLPDEPLSDPDGFDQEEDMATNVMPSDLVVFEGAAVEEKPVEEGKAVEE